MVERRHDKKGDKADRDTEHDELLGWLLFRRRTAAQPPLKERRVLSHEIEGSEHGCAREDQEVYPCLPIPNGTHSDEQQKTHHDGEDSECKPCPCIKFLHSAI